MISKVWEKMSNLSGVRKIMNDIKLTLEKASGEVINMSAGNPLVFKELEEFWEKNTRLLLDSGDFGKVIWRYGSTKWYFPFLDSLKKFFKEEFDQNIKDENILVTTWSQSAFFYWVNAFAWEMQDGKIKKMFLPQSPDYTWYSWMWLSEDMFISVPQKPEKTWKNKFKYKLETNNFPNIDEIWAVVFSRPCNPTWNLMTEEEVEKIYDFVKWTDIPVFVDSAYASPIPNLVYWEMKTKFHRNTIYTMSFSKAWLPWERVWVSIWNPKFIKYLENFHANLSIMSSRFWQALISYALDSGELKKISKEIIQPRYKKKSDLLEECLNKYMPDSIPWYLHEVQGSMFSFLWFEDLPITDDELYERLKEQWVLFVPWNAFFNGIDKDKVKHSRECIRISITVEDEQIEKAAKILSEVIRQGC